MTGRVERDVLFQSGHLPQASKLLVDIRIVLQLEEVLQTSGILIQQSQPLAVEEQIERQAHFDLRLYRTIHQPAFCLDVYDVLRLQGGEIGIAQAGITAEQESVQGLLQTAMPFGQLQLLKFRQFIGHQVRMFAITRLYLEIQIGTFVHHRSMLADGRIRLLLQMLQVLADGIGLVAFLSRD